MLRILHTERRGAGHAYAGIAYLASPAGTLLAALQRHALANHPWQGRLYQAINGQWHLILESAQTTPATLALDAMLETLAPFDLPDDLYPLVLTLLPQAQPEPETAPAPSSGRGLFMRNLAATDASVADIPLPTRRCLEVDMAQWAGSLLGGGNSARHRCSVRPTTAYPCRSGERTLPDSQAGPGTVGKAPRRSGNRWPSPRRSTILG